VTHLDLLEDVCDGEDRETTTIRSTVRHLQQKLRAGGMPELAAAIRGRNGREGGLSTAQHPATSTPDNDNTRPSPSRLDARCAHNAAQKAKSPTLNYGEKSGLN